jgi:hypothetical protein
MMISPVKMYIFEKFKDNTEYQAHLAKELGQLPVVVPEDNTESIKHPTEVSLIEELDETELKKNK